MTIDTESTNAQPRRDLLKKQAGGECALTEDELDDVLGGLEEVDSLVKEMTLKPVKNLCSKFSNRQFSCFIEYLKHFMFTIFLDFLVTLKVIFVEPVL